VIDASPLYMAGIFYPQAEAPPELVTLTTKPTELCVKYHHRMPLLIPEKVVQDWLRLPVDELCGLLVGVEDTVRVETWKDQPYSDTSL
jgi:putative SOS response-associated peptidase YedK